MPTADTTQTSTYSPGLDGILAGETALCHVDEGEGGLRYRGYAVSDLAENAIFEEVAYLLLFVTVVTCASFFNYVVLRQLRKVA